MTWNRPNTQWLGRLRPRLTGDQYAWLLAQLHALREAENPNHWPDGALSQWWVRVSPSTGYPVRVLALVRRDINGKVVKVINGPDGRAT